MEVGGIGGVVGYLLLAQQVHNVNLPCCREFLGQPAAVVQVHQCRQHGGTPLDDGVGLGSTGLGADEDLRPDITPFSSSSEKGAVIMGTALMKNSSACSQPKNGWMEV